MKTTLGWIIFIMVWAIISSLGIISPFVLPSPIKVVNSFIALISEGRLFGNILFSLKINFSGYIIALLTALPIGFIIGSFKTTKELFNNQVNSLRFVPITALGGIFVALSGLTIWTKILFLAFGIWVYLVPVVVQRMEEVPLVNLQMIKTLGATKWQRFIHVQFPYVMSRLSDDIRILVGISWTYIVVAELKNIQGGLGSLIHLGEKQSNSGIVYSAIITIIIIGVLQDKLFLLIDKTLFKYKYI